MNAYGGCEKERTEQQSTNHKRQVTIIFDQQKNVFLFFFFFGKFIERKRGEHRSHDKK